MIGAVFLGMPPLFCICWKTDFGSWEEGNRACKEGKTDNGNTAVEMKKKTGKI